MQNMQDRIFNHYLVSIQELLREERGITGDLQQELSNLDDLDF